MNRFLRAVLASLLVVVGLLGTVSIQVAEAASLDSVEQDLVGRINAFRAGRGLPTLTISDPLAASAKWMSVDMGSRNYFSHTSADGRTPVQRMADAGYPATRTWTGENLAAGYASTADVLNGWINSPGHYAVLVNPEYHAVGVGRAYAAGSTYGWYWTADFGGIVAGAQAAPAPVARSAPVSRAASPVDVRAVSRVPAEVALPPDSGYHASWTAQSADPTVYAGETARVVVALRNTGSRGWYRDTADQQVVLGTDDPQDAEHPEFAANWLSANRLTSTTTDYVGPGEIGWFEFAVRAPVTTGDYKLAVRGVVDGVGWLEDDGIFMTTHVQSAGRCSLSFVR